MLPSIGEVLHYFGASLIHNNIYVRITPHRYVYAHVTYRPHDDYLQAKIVHTYFCGTFEHLEYQPQTATVH